MTARELGKKAVVVGDDVALVGDLSGAPRAHWRGSCGSPHGAASCGVPPMTTTRSSGCWLPTPTQLVIVTALADPPPRTGLVDRCLVAAYTGGLAPILCLTKADLADPGDVAGGVRRARLSTS